MEDKKKPIHEVRHGRVKACIWENRGKNGTFQSWTLHRLYKNDQDEWRESSSFGDFDTENVARVAADLNNFFQTAGKQDAA